MRGPIIVQVAEIQEAFKLFDSDSSGSIDYRELKVLADCLLPLSVQKPGSIT